MINRVDIDSDNQALTRKLLAKTAQQAQGPLPRQRRYSACWPATFAKRADCARLHHLPD
ncbi:hypothetical protein LNP17_08785 [Klebsiella variicola subsp. variicola]|nr:hypothetical protein [Klebsiella variicola subsp. variicola]